MASAWVDDVLRFWFDELKPKQWWVADAGLDERVRVRFGPLRERLARDPPTLATLDARGHLSTVIVFDQFSRNLFRGSREAFATDKLALTATLDAVGRGLDLALIDVERQFLYMPLMHSENPAMQQRSLGLFAKLTDPRASRSAREHYDIIVRFGRFPYRNEALGRLSTALEIEYMASTAPR